MSDKEIIVWQCPECKDTVISKSWEPGITYCECGETGNEFTNVIIRWIGSLPTECKAKRYNLEGLLK
jgi:hypothetical protein